MRMSRDVNNRPSLPDDAPDWMKKSPGYWAGAEKRYWHQYRLKIVIEDMSGNELASHSECMPYPGAAWYLAGDMRDHLLDHCAMKMRSMMRIAMERQPPNK